MVGQFEHGVAQPQIGNLGSATRGVLKIMLKAEIAFVELDRTLKVGDVNRHVIDALEHDFILA
jgi:hypothetical protein